MRLDNLQLPCVQLPASSYSFQLPHGCHDHHGRHGHGGHIGCDEHGEHGGQDRTKLTLLCRQLVTGSFRNSCDVLLPGTETTARRTWMSDACTATCA